MFIIENDFTPYRNGLHVISTVDMPRKVWLEKRQYGLGGSDMGTIMGVNKNFSRLELFYQKLGLNFSGGESHNPATYWGSKGEANVIYTGQYFDFDTGSYLHNEEHQFKLRTIEEFPYMVKNEQYPWLLANVDGIVNLDLTTQLADAIAEAKTISRQAAEMWETIPPYHTAQLTMYMTVLQPILKEEMAMIFYLQDGREFYGYELPMNIARNLRDMLIEDSYMFAESIEAGKEIILNATSIEQRDKALGEIEPEPDATEAYEKFLSELFLRKKNFKRIKGTDQIFDMGIRYKALGKQVSELMGDRRLLGNRIKKWMKDNDANVVDYDSNGKITFNKKFYVNLKTNAA